jgi:hypothetical protein
LDTGNFPNWDLWKRRTMQKIFDEETSCIARFLPSWAPHIARSSCGKSSALRGVNACGLWEFAKEYEGTAVIGEVDTDVHTRD